MVRAMLAGEKTNFDGETLYSRGYRQEAAANPPPIYIGALRPKMIEMAAEIGDGFLLRHGFTLLWLGWQFDPPMRDGLMRVHPPVATRNETPITGLVRSESE